MEAHLSHTFRGSDGTIHRMGEPVVIAGTYRELDTGRVLLKAIYASGQPAILLPNDVASSGDYSNDCP
jgi:hypothetical protein